MLLHYGLADLLDDDKYEAQVLHLCDGRDERQLDEQYKKTDAINLGVHFVPPQPEELPLAVVEFSNSSSTISSPSRHSSSTGLASNVSRASRDFHYEVTSPPTPSASQPKAWQCQPLKLAVAQEQALSTPTSPTAALSPSSECFRSHSSSAVSSQIWSPKSLAFRLKFRRSSKQRKPPSLASQVNSTECRICPDDATAPSGSQRLLCGHTVCFPHLRILVLEQDSPKSHEASQCCANSIPWAAAQAVLAQAGAGADEHALTGLEEAATIIEPFRSPFPRSDLTPANEPSGPQTPRTCDRSRDATDDSFKVNLERAMQFPDFRSLRRQQETERDRFVDYELGQKDILRSRQQETRTRIMERHAVASKALTDVHPQQLSELETRHLEAEIRLEEEQKIETRNCLVALRHMEGYCQGHDPEGTGRIVTLQDRMKLERQYYTWKHLDRRQETAVNILRERQARQMRARSLKQATDITALQASQEEEMSAAEKRFDQEIFELEGIFKQRKVRMMKRWTLATETWKGWREKDEDIDIPWPIEALVWPTS